MNTLLALPLLIPFGGLVVCLCLWRVPAAHRWLALAATSALLASSIVLLWQVWTSGIQVTRVGDWPVPFGIVLVADLLSAIMLMLVAAAALAVTVYSSAAADPARVAFGYYPVFLALVTGLSGAFLTGDIFNLYVWFELALIASFVLMTLGGEPGQIAAGIKYVALSLVASFFLLSATGLLYGLAGTLNMADLAVRLRASPEVGPIAIVSMLFLVAFAIKAAVFPMFFWLPASYPAPPAGISAFFAGSLTKLGIYAMIRCFTLLFTGDAAYLHTVLLWLAGATMLAGVIGAISQRDLRNMLSYQIVGHIGYVLMGLALFTPLALAGAIFYLVHEVIAKTALFLTTGLISHSTGTTEISRLGGLYAARPAMAALFLIPALSISGFPPLSGFFPKLMLVRAGLDVQGYVIAAIALVASLLTLYAIARVWVDGFWKPPTSGALARRPHWALWAPCWFLAGLTVAIGFAAGPVFSLSERAAAELLNPDGYVQAVMGLE